MTKEINKTGPVFTDEKGKKWLPVVISNEALSKINKTILGDQVDKDDFKAWAIVKDVHEDCLELFKEFN
jgi:hypothetical protein